MGPYFESGGHGLIPRPAGSRGCTQWQFAPRLAHSSAYGPFQRGGRAPNRAHNPAQPSATLGPATHYFRLAGRPAVLGRLVGPGAHGGTQESMRLWLLACDLSADGTRRVGEDPRPVWIQQECAPAVRGGAGPLRG